VCVVVVVLCLQVRAAAVYALGTYILNVPEEGNHSELAMTIDQKIAVDLLSLLTDGSPIVRQELASALHGLILLYEKQFQMAALRNVDMAHAGVGNVCTSLTPTGWIHVSIEQGEADANKDAKDPPINATSDSHPRRKISKSESPPPAADYKQSANSEDLTLDSFPNKGGGLCLSTSPTSSLTSSTPKSFYTHVWKGMIFLASDPHQCVARMAQHVVHSVHDKVE